MPHEVRLEVFQGPIDLLLHLITRQRVDIYEVSISTITDEYLRAMASLEELDLETSTGFLIVAATLLELKSVRLLPSRSQSDDGDLRLLEERDLLLARLVECSTFREAGRAIQVALERGQGFHPRSVSLEEPYAALLPDVELKLGLSDVIAAALRVLTPKPQRQLDVSHVSPIKASVRDAIIEMTELLMDRRSATFIELCSGVRDRIDVVVRFLGLLEMFKAGAIELSQLDRFGTIEANWTGDTEATEILEDVEEYTFQEEGV